MERWRQRKAEKREKRKQRSQSDCNDVPAVGKWDDLYRSQYGSGSSSDASGIMSLTRGFGHASRTSSIHSPLTDRGAWGAAAAESVSMREQNAGGSVSGDCQPDIAGTAVHAKGAKPEQRIWSW